MYPRRSLLPVQDSRTMRKAARNNKYLHSLRLKNLRSAVKKKLRNVKKRSRKPIPKRSKIVEKNSEKSEREYKNTAKNLIPNRQDEIQDCTALPVPVKKSEESLAYDAGNKHTRSFSKRCYEMASIYIPCDYSYELSVRKSWPAANSTDVFLQNDSYNLKYNISEIMKDTLDLVLGYCFIYVSEKEKTTLPQEESVTEKSVSKILICDGEHFDKPVELTDSVPLKSVQPADETEKATEPTKLLYRNARSDPDTRSEYPNLPEKCDDLNISEFLRPLLGPSVIKKHTIGRECNPKTVAKRTKHCLFHNSPGRNNNETLLKINKDHSYAKINKETMLQSNSDYMFVNKESSPKQYRNSKRMISDKEGSFQFGTRSKIRKTDSKLIKNNENCDSQVQTVFCPDENQTNEDTSFLKDLVMDTAMLYSMLCGVEAEDIAFYIETRPVDPDQWAIDILDSMH